MSDGDSSNGGFANLSSDDEQDRFTGRLPRHQYSTVDNDDDDDCGDYDSDDDYDNDVDYKYRRRRRLTKEQATYGIFARNDSSEDERGRRRPKRSRQMNLEGAAPLFVKGKVELQDEQTQERKETNDTLRQQQMTERETVIAVGTDDNDNDVDREAARKQEEANHYFLNLVNRAKGKSRMGLGDDGTRVSEQANPVHSDHGDSSTLSLSHDNSQRPARSTVPISGRPGLGSSAADFFGAEPQLKNPNLGKWEKHTKGIGMKLLAKMGYSGSGGLGSKRRKEAGDAGITAPIEVKVRPANLGLGYGNFKEVTHSNKNKEIRSRTRDESTSFADRGVADEMTTTSSSALPTTTELLDQKSWKRGHAQSSLRKRQRREVVAYTSLLEQTHTTTKIIDMRPPEDRPVQGDSEAKEVALAQELLHNLSFMLSTYDNKLFSASHFVKATKQKLEKVSLDLGNIEEKRIDSENRIKKLQRLQSITNQIETLRKDHSADSFRQLKTLVEEIGDTFTDWERKELKLWETMISPVLGDYINDQLNDWSPLSGDINMAKKIISSILTLSSLASFGDDSEVRRLRRSLVMQYLLPTVKKGFESLDWNPMDDVIVGVDLYQVLDDELRRAENETEEEEEEPGQKVFDHVFGHVNTLSETLPLWQLLRRVLIYETVHERLSRSLSQWKPILDSKNQLSRRLDLWIMPWLCFFDDSTLVSGLVSECKRKLRTSLTYLNKYLSKDKDFFNACVAAITPWQTIFKPETIHGMLSTTVTPRIARSISKSNDIVQLKEDGSKSFGVITSVYEWHTRGLLSDHEFLSLIEGEVLPLFVSYLFEKMAGGSSSTELADMYAQFKLRLLTWTSGSKKKSTYFLLRNDEWVCRYLLGAIEIIASSDTSKDIEHLCPVRTNYRSVLARRLSEDRKRAAEELLRMDAGFVGATGNGMDARVRLNREQGVVPTFREVVEEFAREKDIAFQPRGGTKGFVDGKQTFLFGRTPIYLDSNVVFAETSRGIWSSFSLDELAARELQE